MQTCLYHWIIDLYLRESGLWSFCQVAVFSSVLRSVSQSSHERSCLKSRDVSWSHETVWYYQAYCMGKMKTTTAPCKTWYLTHSISRSERRILVMQHLEFCTLMWFHYVRHDAGTDLRWIERSQPNEGILDIDLMHLPASGCRNSF